MPAITLLLTLVVAGTACSQITIFPYKESFDNVVPPALPPGWSSSSNRTATGDFTTTRSSPRSDSFAVISTNATISQTFTSPPLDFSGKSGDSLMFYERRSSSHNAGILVEASNDGGVEFTILPGDTLRNPGTTGYVRRGVKLPGFLSDSPRVLIRWRTLNDGTGTTGTLRMDDITVTARAAVDVSIGGLRFDRESITSNLILLITVRNEGMSPVDTIPIGVFLDANLDSLPQPEEIWKQVTLHAPTPPGDSATFVVALGSLPPGRATLIVRAAVVSDRNEANDVARLLVYVPYPAGTLIINEIMYDPLPGGSEYVELYNRGQGSIDLSEWILTDRTLGTPSSTDVITRQRCDVPQGGYIVVAADSSIFATYSALRQEERFVIVRHGGMTLNNDGDNIVLRDPARSLIDSVSYSESWHNPRLDDASGRSLERINPDLRSTDARNWGTCASPDGGTPLRRNTLFARIIPPQGTLAVHPNPFSPDGDGFEDVTLIAYSLTSPMALLRVRIFDHRGRLVRVLMDGDPAGASGQIVWDGCDQERRRVPVGIYIVLLESIGPGGNDRESYKSPVVVGTRLE